jgi:phage shock protein E
VKTILILLAILCLAALLYARRKSAVPAGGFWEMRDKGAVVIDVRTQAEFDGGHIDGALNIPYDIIGDEIDSVCADTSKLIVVYCRSGHRAGVAKESLFAKGYTNVVNAGAYTTLMKSKP